MAGKIELKAPLDGVLTIEPEDTASNFTVTIPAVTGVVVNDATLRTELNASGSAPIYACRAWVNFDGTGTVAIRASGNVSSITDNGVGDYTVNFTTAMPDTNYAVVLGNSGNNDFTYIFSDRTIGHSSTTSFPVLTRRTSDFANIDRGLITLAVFR